MKSRKYTLNKRAESQEQTRDKIVRAAMELHGTVGAAATSISAIAEHAGVQRLTVYRHFPDEKLLFRACTAKWLQLNPPPPIPESDERTEQMEALQKALKDLYAYFRETESMWALTYRDRDHPALRQPLAEFHGYLDAYAEALLKILSAHVRNTDTLNITARHCVQYSTWASLKGLGCKDTLAAKIGSVWLKGVETQGSASRLSRKI